MAALRFDALSVGARHALWRALGATVPDPEAVTRSSLLEALSHASVWESLRSRFVQTNETTRAVTWLWPAHLAGCDDGGRALAVVEVGTSAGLNLVAHRLPAIWSDDHGAPIPILRAPAIVTRVGIDLRPLDVHDDSAVEWMRACIWSDERNRIERFDAAVDAFRSDPPELVTGNATEIRAVLNRVSSELPESGVALVFQTIVRDYFDAETEAAYERAMRDWLAFRPPGRAIWAELEIDHDEPDKQRPAVIAMHVSADNRTVRDFRLAKTNYHPTDLRVDTNEVDALKALLKRFG